MKTVTLKDKTFGISIPEAELLKAVDQVAEKMNADLKNKNPLFLIVLNGAFMFASDLLKRVEIPAQLSFIKVASYCGTCSTGNVTELIGLNEDVKGRTVVIIEDIIDSGMDYSCCPDRSSFCYRYNFRICKSNLKYCINYVVNRDFDLLS